MPPRRPYALVPATRARPRASPVHSSPVPGTIAVVEFAAISTPAPTARTDDTTREPMTGSAVTAPRRTAGSPGGRSRPSIRRIGGNVPESAAEDGDGSERAEEQQRLVRGVVPALDVHRCGTELVEDDRPPSHRPASPPSRARGRRPRSAPRRAPPAAAIPTAGTAALSTPRSPFSAKCSAEAMAIGPIARLGTPARRVSPAPTVSIPMAAPEMSRVSSAGRRRLAGSSR